MFRFTTSLVLVVGPFVAGCDTTVVPSSPVTPIVSTRTPDPPIEREVPGACCFREGCLEIFPSMCKGPNAIWIGGPCGSANCPPRQTTNPVVPDPNQVIPAPPPQDDFVIVKCYKVDENFVLSVCDGKRRRLANGSVSLHIESCSNCVEKVALTPVPSDFEFGDVNAGLAEWIKRVAYMMYHCQQDGEGCDSYNQVHQIMEELPCYNG